MDTTLVDLSAHQKQEYFRSNGQKIRDAVKNATIFDPDHHYVLMQNPSQALRDHEINHPKYSRLELETFRLTPDKALS